MKEVNITINDIKVSVPENYTVLEAAREVDIEIPTLCHLNLHDLKAVNRSASCRVCVVEVEGRGPLSPSCSTYVSEGMVIRTNTPRAVKARRTMVELLLSDHPKDCLTCEKNQHCDLQRLAADLGVREIEYVGEQSTYEQDNSSYSIFRNLDKCVLCRRCETMCKGRICPDS